MPPRQPLAKQHELDTIFEETVAETPNLRGRCTLVWNMCHVSDNTEGSKLCPLSTISFLSLMPSSSDTLSRNFKNLVLGCSAAKVLKNANFFWVQKIRGHFEFSDCFYFIISERIISNYTKWGIFYFFGKISNFRKLWGQKYFRNSMILDTTKYETMAALCWAKVLMEKCVATLSTPTNPRPVRGLMQPPHEFF